MTPKHSSNSVKARARKIMEAPPPDYVDRPDSSQCVRELTYRDVLTNERHHFEFYISQKRIDQFQVVMDGKVWLERAGWSRALAGLRKAVPRFSQIKT